MDRRQSLAVVALTCLLGLQDNAAADPPAESIRELRFDQFYRIPVGPRGLEMTDTLRALAGQRVRIAGYVVRDDEAAAGSFILAPVKVTMAAHADGEANDLPAAHVVVMLPDPEARVTAPTMRVALTGILHVGRREDAEGRVSWVRLQLEAPPVFAVATPSQN